MATRLFRQDGCQIGIPNLTSTISELYKKRKLDGKAESGKIYLPGDAGIAGVLSTLQVETTSGYVSAYPMQAEIKGFAKEKQE